MEGCLNFNERTYRGFDCLSVARTFALVACDCHFEVCNQVEQRVNSSSRDVIGSTRLNLHFQLDSMHQNDNLVRQVRQCSPELLIAILFSSRIPRTTNENLTRHLNDDTVRLRLVPTIPHHPTNPLLSLVTPRPEVQLPHLPSVSRLSATPSFSSVRIPTLVTPTSRIQAW